MPTIADNRAYWEAWHWQHAGEEWSAPWGGSDRLWDGTIWPRIRTLLPCDHLLEIGTGFGRITRYLLPWCSRLTGLDLAAKCAAACHERFRGRQGARFVACDGRSVPEVAAASVAFAFSWDSLVHAEAPALAGYLSDLARVLAPGAHAFLHHSNLGMYVDPDTGALQVGNEHQRDWTTSAATFRDQCRSAGLVCLDQELVRWPGEHWTDCFSLVVRPAAAAPPAASPPQTPLRWHPDFFAEIARVRAGVSAPMPAAPVPRQP